MVYLALLPLMRTPRLPVVDWTDAPAALNGLVRFAERRNLVSARVPSQFKRNLSAAWIGGTHAAESGALSGDRATDSSALFIIELYKHGALPYILHTPQRPSVILKYQMKHNFPDEILAYETQKCYQI